jgi:hypothetical protein
MKTAACKDCCGGEQKVTVQHGSVSEDGQAIGGNVTQATRANTPDKAAPVVALPHDKTAPMPTIDGTSKAQPTPIRRKRRA